MSKENKEDKEKEEFLIKNQSKTIIHLFLVFKARNLSKILRKTTKKGLSSLRKAAPRRE